jgi:hypothetical protein
VRGRDDDAYGIALAEARIPRWWPLGVAVLVFAQLVATLRKRKDVDAAVKSAREVVVVLAERAKEGDARNDQMAELTANTESMTRTMVVYGRISMGIATASLIVAVVALVLAA